MVKKLFILIVAMSLIGIGVLQAQTTPSGEVVAPITLRATAPDPAGVQVVEIAQGFSFPLYVTHAGDGSGRIFVLEQPGKIWIIQDGVRLSEPFLDLAPIVSQDVLSRYSERGLLGIAFHPNYAENGEFFVNYTDRQGTTQIARYRVSDDPNRADPNSGEILLSIPQPFPNHNGGHMDFGPDGYLYISVGDGGAAGDPLQAGQDRTTLLGTLIRIDVDNTDGAPYGIPEDNPFVGHDRFLPEIWAWGLRNVWRFSFDRETGDVYIADVGQNVWEEVNFQPADSPGGENYGWNIFEASHPYSMGTPPADMVYPIAEYRHTDGNCSVTGGYVYRGELLPDLVGAYFFGDFCTGQIWATYRDLNGEWQTNTFINIRRQISSFGEDEQGELYVVDYRGAILQFVPAR